MHAHGIPGRSILICGALSAALLIAPTLASGVSAVGAVSQYVMTPAPIAPAASLAANTTHAVTVSAEDSTNALVPGSVIYLSFTQTTGGGSASVGTTALTSTPAAFTAANGSITVTYTTPAVLPTGGKDIVKAANAKSAATISALDSYSFSIVEHYTFSPLPIASPGTLLANASVGVMLTSLDSSSVAVPGAVVYLSFVPAVGGGTASVGTTPLSSTPAAFTSNSSGQIAVTYHAPSVLPAGGLDTIAASDSTKNPSITRTDSYSFTGASTYTPINPRRVLDTRPTVASGNPTNIGLVGKFTAGTVRSFKVAGADYVGGGTAPAVPINAVAVTGNLTIVNETAAGVVDLGPAASAGGQTSTLSFVKGDIRANNVTVGLAASGWLAAVYRSSTAGATTDLIFDITGYFLPNTSGATYHTVTPGRILDTRPTGLSGATHIGPLTKLANRTVESFPVSGVKPLGGTTALVPVGAVGVTGNLTVADSTSGGYVALGPTMTSFPSTSTVNVPAGTDVANGVTVALASGRLEVVWCGTTGSSADVIFDVTGYFTAGPGGLSFYKVDPVRLMDSATNLGLTGPFVSRTAQLFTVGGKGGVSVTAKAIAGNLTLINPSSGGWALISPDIVASPTTSTVNASAGHSEANGFDVALSAGGHVALEWAGTVGSTANLALDVTGYWQ